MAWKKTLGRMIMHRYSRFDSHITGYEPDGVDWCDGLGADKALELLAEFDDADWRRLCTDLDHKNRMWRGCVSTILDPNLGKYAQDLLVHLLDDPDEEVSFNALRQAAFYCGVNSRNDGPFLDESICHQEFFSKVKSHDDMMLKITNIKKGTSSYFSSIFTLLEDRISK